MKKWPLGQKKCARAATFLIAGLMAPNLFAANYASDYAYRAPVQPAPNALWMTLPLPAQALAHMQTPDGRDVQVIDSKGQIMPTVWGAGGCPTRTPAPQAVQTTQEYLPHTLKQLANSQAQTGQVSIHINSADGTQTQVQVNGAASQNTAQGKNEIVFDLRKEENSLQSLTLYAALPANLPVDFELEASSNMRDWQRLPADSTLFYFADAAQEARAWTIGLGSIWQPKGQLLKISWPQSAPGVQIVKMTGTVQAATAPAPEGLPVALGSANMEKTGAHTWQVPFASPVRKLDFDVAGTENFYYPITISTRQNNRQPWQTVAHYTLWRAAGQRHQAIMLSPATTLGELRISARGSQQLPSASISAQAFIDAQSLVLMASGTAPYTLVAGKVPRADASLPAHISGSELQSLSNKHQGWGDCWEKLPQATVGAAQVQAIQAQSAIAETVSDLQSDKRKLILWAVLVLGVAILGGVALSLFRSLNKTNSTS